jgi:hypothetical protein
MLVESFDDLAGLAVGVEGWIPVSVEELTRLLSRLHEDPEASRRLFRRAAEHGRARMLVAVVDGPAPLTTALRRSVELFEFLVPAEGAEPTARAEHLAHVAGLMRVTALQLLLGERPGEVPAGVAAAWPRDDLGRRLPVSLLDDRATDALLGALDEHDLLPFPG